MIAGFSFLWYNFSRSDKGKAKSCVNLQGRRIFVLFVHFSFATAVWIFQQNSLTKENKLWYNVYTSKRVYFFARIFMPQKKSAFHFGCWWHFLDWCHWNRNSNVAGIWHTAAKMISRTFRGRQETNPLCRRCRYEGKDYLGLHRVQTA